MNDIPRTNDELVRDYAGLVVRLVGHLNRRPENMEDILQSVWLALVSGRVVEKFWERARRTRPEALTTEEVCLHLGISVESWVAAQGGATHWLPVPLAGEATSLDALWAADDIERYATTAHEHHERVAESEHLIPTVTAANFRTYLYNAVHNAFANWCRTNHRRNKDRVLDCFPDGRAAMAMAAYREDVEPFDVLTDPYALTRRMGATVEVRHALRALDLGDAEPDFVALLADGYTAVEAAKKLSLSRGKVNQIARVLR